jgi:hypothetical protein
MGGQRNFQEKNLLIPHHSPGHEISTTDRPDDGVPYPQGIPPFMYASFSLTEKPCGHSACSESYPARKLSHTLFQNKENYYIVVKTIVIWNTSLTFSSSETSPVSGEKF